MILKSAILIVLGLAPVMLLADSPPGRDQRPGGGRMQRGPGPRGPDFQRPDDPEDLKKAWELLQQYSPKRWAACQSAKEKLNSEQNEKLDRAIMGRYRQMQFLSMQGNEDLRATRLKQLGVEDEIFGIRMEMIEAGGINSPQAEPLKPRLRDKVREQVELRMEDRALHLKRLEEMVKSETEKLAKDRAREDAIVEERMQRELKSDDPGLLPDRGDRPERPPFGPPPDGRNNKPNPKKPTP
jgi:hypothetical protein